MPNVWSQNAYKTAKCKERRNGWATFSERPLLAIPHPLPAFFCSFLSESTKILKHNRSEMESQQIVTKGRSSSQEYPRRVGSLYLGSSCNSYSHRLWVLSFFMFFVKNLKRFPKWIKPGYATNKRILLTVGCSCFSTNLKW